MSQVCLCDNNDAALMSEHECMVCYETYLFAASRHTACSKVFCKRCITRLIGSSDARCPNCRDTLVGNVVACTDEFHSVLCKLLVVCVTCQAEMKYDEYADHLGTCVSAAPARANLGALTDEKAEEESYESVAEEAMHFDALDQVVTQLSLRASYRQRAHTGMHLLWYSVADHTVDLKVRLSPRHLVARTRRVGAPDTSYPLNQSLIMVQVAVEEAQVLQRLIRHTADLLARNHASLFRGLDFAVDNPELNRSMLLSYFNDPLYDRNHPRELNSTRGQLLSLCVKVDNDQVKVWKGNRRVGSEQITSATSRRGECVLHPAGVAIFPGHKWSLLLRTDYIRFADDIRSELIVR